jgi:Poly A polymerase head domain
MLTTEHVRSVNSYLSRIRLNPTIHSLFARIEACGDVILIGGAIRDIALKREIPRDIDLIVDCAEDELRSNLRSYEYKLNSFGGYKLQIDNITFDIWSIENNWAFKNKIVPIAKENITKGAFYNIDAVCINLSDNSFFSEHFDAAVINRELDIIQEQQNIINQVHVLNVARAFRLKQKWNLSFSRKVIDYICSWADATRDPLLTLTNESFRHFGDSTFLDFDLFDAVINENRGLQQKHLKKTYTA